MSPTSRGLLAALATCVLAALVFGVTLAQGAKEVTDYFGSGSATLGAEFNTPRDVAVNQTGAGAGDAGDIYVVDDANNRVQRFDSDREFVSAWGADVSQPTGGSDFEVCAAAANCKMGVASGGNATAAGNGALDNPQSIAIDQDTGRVYVSDRDNRRINAYDGDGDFLFSVGRDVQDPDGDLVAEVCGDVAGDVCRQADGGAGAGEIGATTTAATLGLAISTPDGNPATGTVYLADSQNRRVNTYNLDGSAPASFGSATQFGTTQPREIAVDSRGIVYASDSNNGGEIDRYDSQNANGVGVGFLASIAPPPLLTGTAASATGGLAIDPDTDGAGTSDEDVLYVLRDPSSGPTVVQQFGPVNDPGATAAPAAADDQHGAGASFGTVTGFGGDSSSNRLFVATTTATVGTTAGHRVYILGDAPPPDATLDPVGDPGATSATVEGSVDANGAQAGYRFELSSDDGATWAERPTGGNIPLGAGDDPEDVSYEFEGLDPATEYQVRLVAKQVFGASSDVSNVETFTTDSAAPVVSPLTAADPGETEAALTGSVDSSGEPATYRFEYGLTDDYGSQAPVLDGDLAQGNESVPVTATLTDLEPGTTYHYRLVASNSTGTTEGGDHVFATPAEGDAVCPNADMREGASALLPGCRAYEQVSPVDKNGGDILWEATRPGGRMVANDGERAILVAWTEFAGSTYGGSLAETEYVAERGADGWGTEPVLPRVTPPSLGGQSVLSSADLSTSLLRSGAVLESTPEDLDGAQEDNLYMRDNAASVVSPLIGIDGAASSGTAFYAPVVSDDLGHLVFATTAVLPTGDPGVPSDLFIKVYEVVDGTTRLVSVQADGTPFPAGTLPGGALRGGEPYSIMGASSRDGRHIFISSSNAAGTQPVDIYRRSDGATTTIGSASQRAVPDSPARPKLFRWASSDGNILLFTSREHLTDDANTGPSRSGLDLYRYDFDADELIDISATPGGDGARVLGIVGASESGDRVYFAARGVVVDGEGVDDPVLDDPNLYAWEDDGTAGGSTRFVATLAAADQGNWEHLNGKWTARTTPDGAQLAFESAADLTGENASGVSQVYRYAATAAGGSGELVCVSCNPQGATPLGASTIPKNWGDDNVQRWELTRFLSEDGSRVFFNSEDALVAADGNGENDAYVWEDGEVSLLSSGRSDVPSYMYNASADGDDAFVLTADALVEQDTDSLVDLYDARVGGGFPAPASRSECDGEVCQGAGSSTPPTRGAGSADLRGVGDVAQRARMVLGVSRPSRAQLRRLASGRRIGLRVRVSRAARVRVTARGRVGRRARIAARGAGRARRAGTVVVGLRLNSWARRHVRRGGALRLSLAVRASGARPRALSLRVGGGR